MINACLHFDAAMEQVKTELDRRLLTAPFPVRAYTAHLTLTHGKFIRARAVLACAMDGEKMVPADAAAFAVAIELLHLATLVHDDIMDEADVIQHISEDFPPAYITDGNYGTFDQQAAELDQRLAELGVYHIYNYYDRGTAKLPHGYDSYLDNKYARDNLEKTLEFLQMLKE